MTPSENETIDRAPEAVESAGEKMASTASQLKTKVTDLGRTAAEAIDGSRATAADGLQNTATALHQGAEKVQGMAHTTADKLTATADYLRSHDMKKMMDDVEELVKKNPGPCIIAIGFVGFLVGRSLRRSA